MILVKISDDDESNIFHVLHVNELMFRRDTCFMFPSNTWRHCKCCPLVAASRYPEREVMVLSRKLPFGWKIFDKPLYFFSFLVMFASQCYSEIDIYIKMTKLLITCVYSFRLSKTDLGKLLTHFNNEKTKFGKKNI